MSGIYNWISGAGLTIGGGANGNNNSYADQYEDRADYVPGQSLYVKKGSRSQWLNEYFNTAAFTPNAPGTFGDTGKNIMRAPHTTFGDVGIDKNWTFAERYGVQFRWEFFNVFNHPSFGSPGTTLGEGNFGQISGTGSEPPRVMQGALKFSFSRAGLRQVSNYPFWQGRIEMLRGNLAAFKQICDSRHRLADQSAI